MNWYEKLNLILENKQLKEDLQNLNRELSSIFVRITNLSNTIVELTEMCHEFRTRSVYILEHGDTIDGFTTIGVYSNLDKAKERQMTMASFNETYYTQITEYKVDSV